MNIHLHYIEEGSGYPLILLHGNGESLDYFEHQIYAFAEEFRVVAVDTRGHGLSDRGTAPFTLGQFVEDLKRFMDERCLTRAHILGFSDGGNIAMMFAIKYPEYVEKLILNGANLSPDGVRAKYQIPIEIGYRIAYASAKYSEKALRNAELLGLMVNEPHITQEELRTIKAPTLVIAGSDDMIKGKETAAIHRGIKGSRLKIIRGDHFIAAKNSRDFNKAVMEFLIDD